MNRLNQVKRLTQMFQSNQSINSYILTVLWRPSFSLTFFGKHSMPLTFFRISFNQFNWFNHTSPSKSIDSVTYFMKTKWLSHQSSHFEKKLNQFNQFCKETNRFKSIHSVELIGIQVCKWLCKFKSLWCLVATGFERSLWNFKAITKTSATTKTNLGFTISVTQG